jgi:hypothetical protein
MAGPIEHTLYPEYRVAVTVWSGLVSDGDLIPGYRDLYTHPSWVPGFHELADLRRGDLSAVTSRGLLELAEFVETSLAGFDGTFRTAVLVSENLPFGMARMYSAFAEESPEAVQVFRELAPALSWLEADGLPYR